MTEGSIDSASDQSLIERADRLKKALSRAGGGASIARRIGMPMPTLNNYIAGRDMKVSALIALADACGVSLEWLATGHGAMAGGHAPTDEATQVFGPLVSEPANFMALCMLLSSCQEYHHRVKQVPTLAEVFDWIGPLYPKARLLPDIKIQFKSDEGDSS